VTHCLENPQEVRCRLDLSSQTVGIPYHHKRAKLGEEGGFPWFENERTILGGGPTSIEEEEQGLERNTRPGLRKGHDGVAV